ncbi:MAG: YihY/virulence factor BrkB family protein [Anaerolineaceae bacterium]|nr:YihY/virulence factor BrkB family protein [Anaerolineaceae bacterium]
MPEQPPVNTPRSEFSLWSSLKQVWADFNQRDRVRAAALSYYALLSLFPALVLLLTVANILWGEAVMEEQVARLAQRFFPGDVPAMIISGVENALNQGASLNIIALAGLLWGASSFFSNLTTALDMIFDPTHYDRAMWRNRLIGAATVIILALLLVVALILTSSLRLFSQSTLETPSLIMRPVSLLLPLLLYTCILTLLFRYVPQTQAGWRAIIPGALFGSIGWEVSRVLFAWYLENLATYSVVYGSLGAVIALLLWTFLSMAVLLLSAEISAALHRWRQQRPTHPGKPNA